MRRHYLLCLMQNYLITLTNTLEVQILPTSFKTRNTNNTTYNLMIKIENVTQNIIFNCSCLVSAGRGLESTSTSFQKCFSRFLLFRTMLTTLTSFFQILDLVIYSISANWHFLIKLYFENSCSFSRQRRRALQGQFSLQWKTQKWKR